MRKSLITYSFIAILICFTSCEQMLVQPSKRAISNENMWQSLNDARAALSGCYALTRAALLNENAYWVYGELRSGDFSVTSRNDLIALRSNDLNADYPTMRKWTDWRRFYAAIEQCNLVIENLPKVIESDFRYSENDMQLDQAQAYFLRAFLYFYLTRVWGDVPLVLHQTDGEFRQTERIPQDIVLDAAIRDAEKAVKGLPWEYNGEWPEQQGQYRGQQIAGHFMSIAITKGASLDLLAHIYAWRGEHQKALQYCNEIFDNQSKTKYELVGVDRLTRLDGGFRGRDRNNIWQIDINFDHAEISTTGQLEDWTLRDPHIPKSRSTIYVSKDSIEAIYTNLHDQRIESFFTRLNDAYPEFYKMKQINPVVQDPTLRYYSSVLIMYRYEELYLLSAECKAHLGDIAGAISDLNMVRTERSLSALSPSFGDQDVILDLVLEERRRELIGEGWRWFDLIRFGKVKQFSDFSEEDIENGSVYWPVSTEAMAKNPKIKQTLFWE